MKKSKLIIISCVMALAFTACSSESQPSSTKTEPTTKESSVPDTPESKEESKKESTPETTEESKKEEDSETAEKQNLGDTSTLNDWEIKVSKMKVVDSIDSSAYISFTPEDGNKFVQVFVSITNKGKSSDTFLPSYGFGDDISAKLLYGDGYEYSASNLLGYDKELHDSNLNPLASAKKEVAFDIPESVTSSKDELLLVFSAGDESVTYKIR